MHFKGRSCPNCGKKTTLNFLNFEAEDKITCCYCGKSFSKVDFDFSATLAFMKENVSSLV